MACLKGLIEFVLTHVRLPLQADVPFDANEIGASIFMRIEPSGLIGGRTPSLTPRAQLMGSQNESMYGNLLFTLSPPIALVLVVASALARPLRPWRF